MAELVGTFLSGLGLMGLFTVCVDCFSYIQAGRSMGKDFVLLEGQFSAIKLRFIAWSVACGFFSSDGYDRRLDNDVFKANVTTQLNCICILFLDARRLIRRYDIRMREAKMIAPTGENAEFITESLNSFLTRINETRRSTKLWSTVRWSLQDRNKFRELIQNLDTFVRNLEWVANELGKIPDRNQYVELEIEAINDEDELEQLVNREDGSADIVSETASNRLFRIAGSATIATSALSDRTYETFETAPTSQKDPHVEESAFLAPVPLDLPHGNGWEVDLFAGMGAMFGRASPPPPLAARPRPLVPPRNRLDSGHTASPEPS
jgi:hypothetical protein